MNVEWVAVAISILVAAASAFQIWQNVNIKLAVSKVETNMETKLGTIREWARETFVSKNDQLNLLELLGRNDKNAKS